MDDVRVAWTYRAYNEEGSPYVVVLNNDGDDYPLALIQAPIEFLDGEPDEEADLANAKLWVHRLTELVEKAQAYDEIFDDAEDALADFHDLHVVEEDDDWDDEDELAMTATTWLPTYAKVSTTRRAGDASNAAYTVYELTDSEVDQEWVDIEGDHLKFIDGEWHISEINPDGETPWAPVSGYTFLGDLLSDYGPYTVAIA